MRIGIPKETHATEKRVAAVPKTVQAFQALGCSVCLEKDAGALSGYPDELYRTQMSGEIDWYEDQASLYANSDCILVVQPPGPEYIAHAKPGTILLGLLSPSGHPDVIQALLDAKITSFAMERIPRIARAQSMDVLSSQASVAGYKAVLIAANLSPRLLPMMTTAAGAIPPANVLVIGTGVAGLQAIATAKRLGAAVRAYDIRSATKEQVASLGAKMIETGIEAEASGGYARALTQAEQEQQAAVLAKAIEESDIIITTAAIPGKPAPKIITQAMVERMRAGSLIVDVAAETGGNCVLTQPGQTIYHKSVCIVGQLNLPASVAYDASSLYARNLFNWPKPFIHDGALQLDWTDPIVQSSALTRDGQLVSEEHHNA